jgi:hypothetical protein
MTTTMRPKGLRGWSFRCVSVALALAFCASAFAGAGNTREPTKVQSAPMKNTRKLCYTFSICSGIPILCDRLAGPVPTTAGPMDIYGRSGK